MAPKLPYKNTRSCGFLTAQKKPCSKLACWGSVHPRLTACGTHKKRLTQPVKLVEDPDTVTLRKQRREFHKATVTLATQINRRNGKRGRLTVGSLEMKKETPYKAGELNVFPNNYDRHRVGGVGVPELSPMALGPVNDHGQKDVPDPHTVENAWQCGKLFPLDADKDGRPTPAFFQKRQALYGDPRPYRHHPSARILPETGKREPCIAWVDQSAGTDNIRLLTYLGARHLYCKWFADRAREAEQFEWLEKQLDEGVNICIRGYDGRPVVDLTAEYCNGDAPFGHELVLAAMLTMPPEEWPWTKQWPFTEQEV